MHVKVTNFEHKVDKNRDFGDISFFCFLIKVCEICFNVLKSGLEALGTIMLCVFQVGSSFGNSLIYGNSFKSFIYHRHNFMRCV